MCPVNLLGIIYWYMSLSSMLMLRIYVYDGEIVAAYCMSTDAVIQVYIVFVPDVFRFAGFPKYLLLLLYF